MRKLTEGRAIKLTLKMWRWMAETGKGKEDYFELADKGKNKPHSECFLCDYNDQNMREVCCVLCPYYRVYGHCNNFGAPYSKWYDCWIRYDIEGARIYAGEFVKELEALLEKK